MEFSTKSLFDNNLLYSLKNNELKRFMYYKDWQNCFLSVHILCAYSYRIYMHMCELTFPANTTYHSQVTTLNINSLVS